MNGKKACWTGTSMINFNKNVEKIPDEFKKIAKDFSEKGFITTSFDNLVNCRTNKMLISHKYKFLFIGFLFILL